MFKSLSLFSFCGFLLLDLALCLPDGPPLPEICDPVNQLIPQHVGTAPQTTPSPFSVEIDGASYVAGSTINVQVGPNMDGSGVDTDLPARPIYFRGFMIQARPVADGDAFGTFRLLPDDEKSELFGCPTLTEFNTAAHRNPDLVQSISLNWGATEQQLNTINEFKFYCTVVTNYSTYWVMLSSDSIRVGGSSSFNGSSTSCLRESYSLYLIKAHGCAMCIAWGLLAPIGILIALFYKVIWPNGEWFYSHLSIMIGTLVLTICGLIFIIVHASGRWLTTTPVNLPHQVFGILAAAAVGINPFIAILRCDPSSKCRWLYNWIHGLTGLILGQVAAFCAMILGLNIYRECAADVEFVRYSMYTVSATIGAVMTVIAFYNIYAVNYSTHNEEPKQLISSSEPPGSFPSFNHVMMSDQSEDDAIDEEPSEDYPVRAAFGIGIIAVLFLLTVANVTLLSLT